MFRLTRFYIALCASVLLLVASSSAETLKLGLKKGDVVFVSLDTGILGEKFDISFGLEPIFYFRVVTVETAELEYEISYDSVARKVSGVVKITSEFAPATSMPMAKYTFSIDLNERLTEASSEETGPSRLKLSLDQAQPVVGLRMHSIPLLTFGGELYSSHVFVARDTKDLAASLHVQDSYAFFKFEKPGDL